ALVALLAAGDEVRELLPVLDPLQEEDLVMAARPGRRRPAGDDRDHARLPGLGIEDRAERLDVLLELAREGPARVVEVERRRLGLDGRGSEGQIRLGEGRPGRGQQNLGSDLAPERARLALPVPRPAALREGAPGGPVAYRRDRHGLVARTRAVGQLPVPEETGLAVLLEQRAPAG